MSYVDARRCDGTLQYEKTYPWEDERGSATDRTVETNAKAQRVYAMQQQLIPTLKLERPQNTAANEHLKDVGRRVLILRETTKRAQEYLDPEKYPKLSMPSQSTELDSNKVIEVEEDFKETEMRITTILMDQDWDTRAWNSTKIQTAIETLYAQIEHSDDDFRRELAISMLLRLLKTHEDAKNHVEISLPGLASKAFRTFTKGTNNIKIFRMIQLVAVLAEWFAHVLSNENVVSKIIASLLRETEVCAQILQHHWRGRLFRRAMDRQNYDLIVQSRFHSMHMIKLVELRHKLKLFREGIGPEEIPGVVHAYITILYHLVKLRRQADLKPERIRRMVLLDQRQILSSGLLVYLAALITRRQNRETIELVKGIFASILEGHRNEHIVNILQCNIVQRVQVDLTRTLQTCSDCNFAVTSIQSSLNLLHAIASQAHVATEQWDPLLSSYSACSSLLVKENSTVNSHNFLPSQEERIILMRKLKSAACQFLLIAAVFDTLVKVLTCCRDEEHALRAQALDTLCLLTRSMGFSQLLDALTRAGGRQLEVVLQCLKDPNVVVAQATANLFYELTSHADVRHGFTIAGAVQCLIQWCQPTFEACESRMAYIMGLIGCTLLARQTKPTTALATLSTFEERIDALYNLLLDLAMQDKTSMKRSASFLLSVNVLLIMLKFITQVSPSCLGSSIQNSRQRNISCIFLGRLFTVTPVAQACFSEDIVNYLALSIQCNRLDRVEGFVAQSSSNDYLIHELGSLEACKALSRLARCPSKLLEARLQPSSTSFQVPELPQALICEVIFRLHVLEDLIAFIRPSNDAGSIAHVQCRKVVAAVELMGYLRPLPYGERAREKFLKFYETHPDGKYAQAKLEQLVKLVCPAILRILRDRYADIHLVSACCVALSRLACTNSACHMMLMQGCLQIALIHLPDNPISIGPPASSPKTFGPKSEVSHDNHELLDVPASLYSLFGKLCSVAKGRSGIMRAQVLPHLLKRLQMEHPILQKCDDECKSEIAVVISRLAVVNAVEGSAGELFVHFRVLDLLAKILQQHQSLRLTLDFSSKQNNDDVTKWRLLVNSIGAIAALSQNVLVCVPRVVALDIVALLFPYLAIKCSLNVNLESLQYDAVTIIRSIASYPHGRFHSYLSSVRGTYFDEKLVDKTKQPSDTDDEVPSTVLMDRIKQIAFDYKLELENKIMTLRDKTSVGELARDTLAYINEHQQRLYAEQRQEHCSKSNVADKFSAALTSCPSSKYYKLHASMPSVPKSSDAYLDEVKTWKAARGAGSATSGYSINAPSVFVLEKGCKSPVNSNGVNIAMTRPPGNMKSLPLPRSPHNIMTRSMLNTKKRDKNFAHCLMLDPLFNTP
ncbi:hypothetical protein Plhal304r1_c007g0026831 [Plasmopara halstedii]